GDLVAGLAHSSGRRSDRPVARAPAQHPQPCVAVRVIDLEWWDRVGDLLDLLGADVRHAFMVLGVVADIAGAIFLLEPPDAVTQTRRARDRPRACHGIRVTEVGS